MRPFPQTFRLSALLLLVAVATPASVAQAAGESELLAVRGLLDSVWVIVAAALVMVMQIGFLLIEAGMVRSKNSINVAMKNVMDFCASILFFALIGFMFAFGTSSILPVGIDLDFAGLANLSSSALVNVLAATFGNVELGMPVEMGGYDG